MSATTESRTPLARTSSHVLLLLAAAWVFPALITPAAPAADVKLLEESRQAMEKADPFMGDWEGIFTQRNKKTAPLVAQVVALGKDRYHATLLPEFDKRTTTIANLEGLREGDAIRFFGWGDVSCYRGPDWEGKIENGKFTGSVPAREGGTFELRKVVRIPPTLGARPPAGAVVLFDGTNYDQWHGYVRVSAAKKAGEKKNAGDKKAAGEKAGSAARSPAKAAAAKAAARIPGPVKWVIADGAMRAVPGSGSVVTRNKFNFFKLHLEFRTPFMPEAREQARGNSGVKLHNLEIQVLDTYGLVGRSKECGGIYGRVDPSVNMCAPPQQWQTFDVTVQPAGSDGKARLTVLQNGVAIHEGLEIGAIAQPTTIELQDHSNPVEYRNVWLVELR